MEKLFDFGLHGIGTLLRSDLANALVLSGRVDGLPAFPLTVGKWLFHINVLASLHGPNGR